jgi:endonuclease-3 related protein
LTATKNGHYRPRRSMPTELLNRTQGEIRQRLRLYYRTLLERLGPQRWWPARTRFEVIVGAILTQNTSWTNVERAVAALRRQRLLTPKALANVPLQQLESAIRPAGYYRQKARRLKAFVSFLQEHYGGSLRRMFQTPTATLRHQLLQVHGIGPETADSILLYAGHHPVFVVDAYTRRILSRHGLLDGRLQYEQIQRWFEAHLPRSAPLFNEYHALLVEVGKRWCHRQQPDCSSCPLGRYRETAG